MQKNYNSDLYLFSSYFPFANNTERNFINIIALNNVMKSRIKREMDKHSQ